MAKPGPRSGRPRPERSGADRDRPRARSERPRPERDRARRESSAESAPGLPVLYGRNAVHEALRGPRAVREVWATEGAARESWLQSVTVRKATAEEIERRCGSPEHQGICAEVEEYRYADVDALLAAPDALIVALDEIQDPQNLGAICRTAECAGATGVVIPERRSAEVTPAVCKASAGAVEHLAIARVRNLADFLLAAKSADVWSYGADGDARVGYAQPDYRGKVVLVMGSEGSGLRPRVARSCDELIALPLRGRIGSLNVSAAAAALLYEITRQRA
ncbi:MAG TPA: 23S rRNA (guanosine(2251)-2'-O)-methyltransferase RlmB [Conexibacter sp.]|nr:23S rRNA (guanosine(2251)-2'-O)-methyltransferase RlmB [Conexibacter sp.]